VEIPQRFKDEMIKHSLEENPNECCGLLAAKDGEVMKHYRITNAERSPYRYSMDAQELLAAYREIDDSGWEVEVIYHSHTHSPAYPSDTDVRLATWPDSFYLLVSLVNKDDPELRVFRILDGEVIEEPLVIT
jgi:proteasome lid subunit RPN8/RPN11